MNEMITPTDNPDPSIDVRRLRLQIQEFARGRTNMAGKYIQDTPYAAMVARRALDYAHAKGLSGEDTMTLLAHHVLQELDRYVGVAHGFINLDVRQTQISPTGD